MVDDTGFPKKGVHSVGVARQYSGTLGRTDNCQVATSLHLAGEQGSGCIGFTLYLSEHWAADMPRRRTVGVPDELTFRRKWEIALAQIDAALGWGVRKHVVLADAATATSLSSGTRSALEGCSTWLASPARAWCGRPAVARAFRDHRPARVAGDRTRAIAMKNMRPFKSAILPRASSIAAFGGARDRRAGSARDSPRFAFASRTDIGSRRHLVTSSGSSASGPRRSRRRASTTCRAFRKARRCTPSYASPSCGGVSSATTRSSSRRSASITLRAAPGRISPSRDAVRRRARVSRSAQGAFPPGAGRNGRSQGCGANYSRCCSGCSARARSVASPSTRAHRRAVPRGCELKRSSSTRAHPTTSGCEKRSAPLSGAASRGCGRRGSRRCGR